MGHTHYIILHPLRHHQIWPNISTWTLSWCITRAKTWFGCSSPSHYLNWIKNTGHIFDAPRNAVWMFDLCNVAFWCRKSSRRWNFWRHFCHSFGASKRHSAEPAVQYFRARCYSSLRSGKNAKSGGVYSHFLQWVSQPWVSLYKHPEEIFISSIHHCWQIYAHTYTREEKNAAESKSLRPPRKADASISS